MGKSTSADDKMRAINDTIMSMSVESIVSTEDPEERKELKEKYFDSLLSDRSKWEKQNADNTYKAGKFVGFIEACFGVIAGCELLKIGSCLWHKIKKK